jgi:hypothetical protein
MIPENTNQGTENRFQPGSAGYASTTSVPAHRQSPLRSRYPWQQAIPAATEAAVSGQSSSSSLTLDQLAGALFAELRDDPATTKAATNILTRLREMELRKHRTCPTCHQPVPESTTESERWS